MAKTVRGQISAMIRDVEKAARQIRTEVSKQYKGTPKVLDDAASQLRRGAAEAAYQVERYIREVRMELQESGKATKKKPRRKTAKRAAKKTTRKKTTKRAAKKTTRKKATKKTAKRATKKTARKKTTRKKTTKRSTR